MPFTILKKNLNILFGKQLKDNIVLLIVTDFSSLGRAFDCNSFSKFMWLSKGSWFDPSKSEFSGN